MSRSNINRRQILRGLGYTAAALPVFRPGRLQAQGTSAIPKRFIFIHNTDGTLRDKFFPNTTAKDVALSTLPTISPILAPLDEFKSRMLILRGINVSTISLPGLGDDHRKAYGTMTTGRELADIGGNTWANGISVDQEIAKVIGTSTRFPSLQFSARSMPNEVRGRISYSGPGKPLPPMDDPFAAYDRVFAGGLPAPPGDSTAQLEAMRLLSRRRSVLDHATASITSLKTTLGADDRGRLDAHLESIKAVERGLQTTFGTAPSCAAPTLGSRTSLSANDSMPTALKLQMDVIAAAVACDLTRVVTLQMEAASSGLVFSWLGITGKGRHDWAHTGENLPEAQNAVTKISTWYAEQLAYLARKLASMPERDGKTLLDHTVIVWANDMARGPHTFLDLPYVLIGSAGGYFRTGRYVEFGRTNLQPIGSVVNDVPVSPGVSHCNLLLSLCQAMGSTITTFGHPMHCTGPLPGLT